MGKRESTCVLCGKPIKADEPSSTYRVEGDITGFARHLDMKKAFHNECLTQEDGINEIARAQVLDYLEAVSFNSSQVENLRSQNLDRAKKIMRELKWREKYDKEKD